MTNYRTNINKINIKELIGIILFSILNAFIAYVITCSLGISNTIIYSSLSLTVGDITWEVIIFFILSIIEALIYESGR